MLSGISSGKFFHILSCHGWLNVEPEGSKRKGDMGIKKIIKLSVLPLLLAGTQANAATISYYLDQSNALLDGVNYAQLTITDSGENIDFSVEIISSAFSVTGANFGMQSFAFNYDSGLLLDVANISYLNPDSWAITPDSNAGGGFGKFGFELQGTGNTRTELLTFSIVNVVGDSVYDYALGSNLNPSSGEFFAAHIAGFDETDGVTGAQFSGSTFVVPAPSSVWLFGSGLIGIAGLVRWKART